MVLSTDRQGIATAMSREGPAFGDDLCLPERVEDLPVQQLVPEPGIEALDQAVLHALPFDVSSALSERLH